MNRIRHWLPVLLWATIIFYFSAQERAPQVSKNEGTQLALQKVGHATEYAILALLVHLALRRGHQFNLRRATILAALIAAGYGVTDEFHQSFVPGRYCMMSDMAIDATGGIIAATALYAYESRRSQQTNR
jgi:VanZ family protein